MKPVFGDLRRGLNSLNSDNGSTSIKHDQAKGQRVLGWICQFGIKCTVPLIENREIFIKLLKGSVREIANQNFFLNADIKEIEFLAQNQIF